MYVVQFSRNIEFEANGFCSRRNARGANDAMVSIATTMVTLPLAARLKYVPSVPSSLQKLWRFYQKTNNILLSRKIERITGRKQHRQYWPAMNNVALHLLPHLNQVIYLYLEARKFFPSTTTVFSLSKLENCHAISTT